MFRFFWVVFWYGSGFYYRDFLRILNIISNCGLNKEEYFFWNYDYKNVNIFEDWK